MPGFITVSWFWGFLFTCGLFYGSQTKQEVKDDLLTSCVEEGQFPQFLPFWISYRTGGEAKFLNSCLGVRHGRKWMKMSWPSSVFFFFLNGQKNRKLRKSPKFISSWWIADRTGRKRKKKKKKSKFQSIYIVPDRAENENLPYSCLFGRLQIEQELRENFLNPCLFGQCQTEQEINTNLPY